ncbi:MAG: MBL fold metallo-hydrolase, partial [Oscillospiraceae bacterium]
MIFLGTGASEGIPCCFCSCEYCNHARLLKEKNIRTRSSFMIDKSNLIDFSPDVFKQCLDNELNLSDLKNIFFTHTHDDHLDISELITITSATPALPNQVNLYFSKAGAQMFDSVVKHYITNYGEYTKRYFDNYRVIVLEPFQSYEIDGLTVTPIISSHSSYGKDEKGFNYFIKNKEGISFLYACDTGWYSEETWDFLKNQQVDKLIIECTYGMDHEILKPFAQDHLDYKNMISMIEKFETIGLITLETPVYVTHISH